MEEEKSLGFPGHDDFLVPAYLDLWARVASVLHDADAAATLYARLARWSRLVVFTVVTVHGAVSHNLAALAAVLGRHDAADEHFAAALQLHERLKTPFFTALTLLEWARAIQQRGGDDSARADEMLRRANGLATQHGFAALEERSSRLLSGRQVAS